jgi:hypothetical protein
VADAETADGAAAPTTAAPANAPALSFRNRRRSTGRFNKTPGDASADDSAGFHWQSTARQIVERKVFVKDKHLA